MSEIETDVTQERVLARTLIELRETYTRAKMLLPAVSLQEMLMLAGAVEQAKSAGMKTTPRKQGAEPEEEVLVAGSSLTVSTGKGKQTMALVVAVAKLLTDGPMSVREILDAFKEKGWKLNTKTSYPMRVLRKALSRSDQHFATVHEGHNIKFKLKTSKRPTKQGKPKLTAWQTQQRNRAGSRDKIVKTLAGVREPISIAALAEKMGRKNSVGIVPVMISLADAGAVKKVKKGDETLWDPVKDKLKEYGAANSVAFTKAHVSMLNGVSN